MKYLKYFEHRKVDKIYLYKFKLYNIRWEDFFYKNFREYTECYITDCKLIQSNNEYVNRNIKIDFESINIPFKHSLEMEFLYSTHNVIVLIYFKLNTYSINPHKYNAISSTIYKSPIKNIEDATALKDFLMDEYPEIAKNISLEELIYKEKY